MEKRRLSQSTDIIQRLPAVVSVVPAPARHATDDLDWTKSYPTLIPITDSSNDNGGGGSTDVRQTNSMKVHSSRNDMVGSSHKDNTQRDSNHSPDIQTQFQPKPEHQNGAREQKRILRPPMQLREVFSSSLSCPPYDWTGGTAGSFRLFLWRDRCEGAVKRRLVSSHGGSASFTSVFERLTISQKREE